MFKMGQLIDGDRTENNVYFLGGVIIGMELKKLLDVVNAIYLELGNE